MVMLGQFMHISQNFEISHNRPGPGLKDDDLYSEMLGNHIMA